MKQTPKVRSKRDIRNLLLTFEEYADWDTANNKLYMTLHKRTAGAADGDKLTVMQYVEEGVFTVYRQSERVWDVRETEVGLAELVSELWAWRKALNNFVKKSSSIRQ